MKIKTADKIAAKNAFFIVLGVFVFLSTVLTIGSLFGTIFMFISMAILILLGLVLVMTGI